jgi:hypothetical protein
LWASHTSFECKDHALSDDEVDTSLDVDNSDEKTGVVYPEPDVGVSPEEINRKVNDVKNQLKQAEAQDAALRKRLELNDANKKALIFEEAALVKKRNGLVSGLMAIGNRFRSASLLQRSFNPLPYISNWATNLYRIRLFGPYMDTGFLFSYLELLASTCVSYGLMLYGFNYIAFFMGQILLTITAFNAVTNTWFFVFSGFDYATTGITTLFSRCRALYRVWCFRDWVKKQWADPKIRYFIIIVLSCGLIFLVIRLLRKRKNKDDKEDSDEKFVDQGWTNSKDDLIRKSRIATFMVAMSSLVMFSDFSFYNSMRNALEFIKNSVFLLNGVESSCSNTACAAPAGKELCGNCRSDSILEIMSSNLKIKDSPDHISANPLAYARTLIRDIVLKRDHSWFFRLSTTQQVSLAACYGMIPQDFMEEKYTIIYPKNTNTAWFQPPSETIFPPFKEGKLLDNKAVGDYHCFKYLHVGPVVPINTDLFRTSSDDEENSENSRTSLVLSTPTNLKEKERMHRVVTSEQEYLYYQNFYSVNYGPWKTTKPGCRFVYPIMLDEENLSFFASFKSYLNKVPVIGRYIDHVICLTIFIALVMVVYYKIDSVHSAIDNIFNRLSFTSAFDRKDESKSIVAPLSAPVKVQFADNMEVIDEVKSFNGNRQKGNDRKHNRDVSAKEFKPRIDTNPQKLNQVKARVMKDHPTAFKLREYVVYDDASKIVNTEQGYPMTKAGVPTKYARSLEEVKQLRKQGYKSAAAQVSAKHVHGKMELPPELFNGSYTKTLLNNSSKFVRGDGLLNMCLLPVDRINLEEEKDDYDLRYPPVLQSTLDIMLSEPGSEKRNGLVEKFISKYGVKLNESASVVTEPVYLNFESKKEVPLCIRYSKEFVCKNKKCKFSHPKCLISDESFVHPDARNVACPVGKCVIKGCPYLHKAFVPKDEGLLGQFPPPVIDSRCCFRVDKRVNGNWFGVGQAWTNGSSFISASHIVKREPVKDEDLSLFDPFTNKRHPVSFCDHLDSHECNETCDDDCKIRDIMRFELNISTDDLNEIRSRNTFKITSHASVRPGDVITLCRLDLKTGLPQMATGSVGRVGHGYFTHDIPSSEGFSAGVFVINRTGHVGGLHKGTYGLTSNRAMTFTNQVLQIVNNPGGRRPKNVLTSKM